MSGVVWLLLPLSCRAWQKKCFLHGNLSLYLLLFLCKCQVAFVEPVFRDRVGSPERGDLPDFSALIQKLGQAPGSACLDKEAEFGFQHCLPKSL